MRTLLIAIFACACVIPESELDESVAELWDDDNHCPSGGGGGASRTSRSTTGGGNAGFDESEYGAPPEAFDAPAPRGAAAAETHGGDDIPF